MALVSGALLLVTTAYAQNGASLCANGTAVPDAANNPGLASDCDVLLASKETLRGNLPINWSERLSIYSWRGVSIAGGRVVGIDLGGGARLLGN